MRITGKVPLLHTLGGTLVESVIVLQITVDCDSSPCQNGATCRDHLIGVDKLVSSLFIIILISFHYLSAFISM